MRDLLKYSDDQPRDEGGRFAAIDALVTGTEDLKTQALPKAEDSYVIDGDKGVKEAYDVSDEAGAAMEWYSSTYAINAMIRAGRLDEIDQEQIKNLDEYIGSNETAKAYIGVRGTEVDTSLRGMSPEDMVGKSYTESAYTSMSALVSGAGGAGYIFKEGANVEGVVAGPPAQVVIYMPKGTNVGIDVLGEEDLVETVLPRETEFTVKFAETRQDPDVGPYTYMEVVADTSKAQTGEKSFKYSEDQERDDRGRWTSGGGGGGTVEEATTNYRNYVGPNGETGSREDPIPCKDDIELAAYLISEGKAITLAQPDQVATLLDKMQEMVKEAQAAGKDAPKFDLCNASVEGTNLFCQDNLDVPRINMPQFSGTPEPGSIADQQPKNDKGEVNMAPQFMAYLRGTGKTVNEETIDASHLRASQSELVGAKVAAIADILAAGGTPNRIWVTNDNYVVDGHHNWAAAVAEQYRTGETINMPIYRVNADIGTVLTESIYWTQEVGIAPKSGKSFAVWFLKQQEQLFDFDLRLLALFEDMVAFEKEFDEDQHPRDDHGRFTSGGGDVSPTAEGRLFDIADIPKVVPDEVPIATDTIEAHVTYVVGLGRFNDMRIKNGLPPFDELFGDEGADPEQIYSDMNVQLAEPEDVTPDQAAVIDDAVQGFVADPKMQPYFDAFGVPEFVMASNVIGSDELAGEDPTLHGVVAQWSNGTMFLYGGTMGDPQYLEDHTQPGFTVGVGSVDTMHHEYGHQVDAIVGWDESGNVSDEKIQFIEACFDGNDPARLSADEVHDAMLSFGDTLGSEYATSQPSEAFAECFSAVTQEDFNIDNYDEPARGALQVMLDILERHT